MSNKKDTQEKEKKETTKNAKNEFVIVESGSKQYILEQGSVISIEKISHPKDGKVALNSVLLHSKNDKVTIGAPYLDLVVKAEIIQDEKDKKIRVFKFKKKTGYKKTQGHRQVYTTIRVLSFDKPTGSSKTTKPKETSTKESTNKKTKK